MDFKRLSVIATLALALAIPAWAQDDSNDDEGWAKSKTTFCKMCMTYFSNDDIPKYVITR